jgi:exodeoxyribonuclease VII large subunit
VVGVVTSEHGAALHDIIRVAQQRCPVRIVLSPCTVQGAEAPRSIARALKAIERVPNLDVVIVGRGGGSAEDLIAFNDERLARVIAACPVPVVSAVGHEVDVSISDLVADVRASTPSNAAELCVPERAALQSTLASHTRHLSRALESRIARERLRLDRAARKLGEPRTLLAQTRSRVEQAARRAEDAIYDDLSARRRAFEVLRTRLSRRDPRLRLSERAARLSSLRARLRSAAEPLTARRRARLSEQAARLQAMSPLSVLSRGYAIALSERTGKALLSASDARPGDALRLRLHDGELRAQVTDDGGRDGQDGTED